MKLGSFFETRKRDNGDEYSTLIDSRPEWLHNAVREAHSGDLPNDWIYLECRAACDAIDEGSLRDDDAMHEYADGRVDVYTQALYQWAADFCLSRVWAEAESEAEDFGVEGAIEDKLRSIQFCAIRRIAQAMLDAMRASLAEEAEAS